MKHNDYLFMDVAIRVAKESAAQRLKVGCVLAKDGSIIEIGYNGTAPGWETNICEYSEDDGKTWKTKPEVIHSEANVFMKCARRGIPTDGTFLYITHAPCHECAKLIIAAGVKKVFYRDLYRDSMGLEILSIAKIECVKLEDRRHNANL